MDWRLLNKEQNPHHFVELVWISPNNNVLKSILISTYLFENKMVGGLISVPAKTLQRNGKIAIFLVHYINCLAEIFSYGPQNISKILSTSFNIGDLVALKIRCLFHSSMIIPIQYAV